jgi:hypothetical protein
VQPVAVSLMVVVRDLAVPLFESAGLKEALPVILVQL